MAELTTGHPVLYSFRRCPYAMRARSAVLASGLMVELREVQLKQKPEAMRQASAKGTVPVLVCPDGTVIDESLDVMHWALQQADPLNWLACADGFPLIAENDGPFKYHLDRFKYSDRYPGCQRDQHQSAGLRILTGWNALIDAQGWLCGDQQSLVDAALWPFVRQWRIADPTGFDADPALVALRAWLSRFLESPAMDRLMGRMDPWSPGDKPQYFPADSEAVPLDQPLFHLALEQDWINAQASGYYNVSTRGLNLDQVGFIHLSWRDQVADSFNRFYADAGAVLVLEIDPFMVASPLRADASPSGELFPHLYGRLPVAAVVAEHPAPDKV
ncbi:MAG: DUF952 domain-containing protein [Synechococcus sp.]